METPNPLKIKKERLQVVIFTQNYRVEGEVHIQPGSRLTDFINVGDKSFIAVTNARVYNLSEEEPVHVVDFLTLNRNGITMAFPMARPQ